MNSWPIRRIRRIRHWIKGRSPAALILLYHRVTEDPVDPMNLCVTPRHFSEHLAILREKYSIISLRTLIRQIEDKSLRPFSVVITFDDGYADNLYKAKPIIENFDARATVFVVSGKVGDLREFWWDELTRVFFYTNDLPEHLALEMNGNIQKWHLADSVSGHIGNKSRWIVYWEVAGMLWRMEPDSRSHITSQLVKWAGLTLQGQPASRVVNVDELCLLTCDGSVEIGAHTVNHPVLSILSASKQRAEVLGSKRQLEEWLGRAVSGFSFPHGGLEDYDHTSVNLVREAGFAYACANWPATVGNQADIFQLPRFVVRNWDGEMFQRNISSWFSQF